MGDHEDLEAHEIEQSKPMSARELAAAEKGDDDSVKSKASKFDPNSRQPGRGLGRRPEAAGDRAAFRLEEAPRNNDVRVMMVRMTMAPSRLHRKKQLRDDPAPVVAAAVPPADALSNDIVAALAAADEMRSCGARGPGGGRSSAGPRAFPVRLASGGGEAPRLGGGPRRPAAPPAGEAAPGAV